MISGTLFILWLAGSAAFMVGVNELLYHYPTRYKIAYTSLTIAGATIAIASITALAITVARHAL